MTTILALIFVLGVLVFVHELGHFLAARSVGVRVERFSIGFPPRLLTFIPTEKGWVFKLFFYRRIEDGKLEWGPVLEKTLKKIPRKATETEFNVALIPLGGYVKMAGTIDESLDDEITGAPDELTSKSRLQQAWVMSAGVIMNLILAVLVYTGVSWSQGAIVSINDEPVVGVVADTLLQINPESATPMKILGPAFKAGIRSGDRIVTIDSKEINSWNQMTSLIHSRPGDSLSITWSREGFQYTDSVVPIVAGKDVCDCRVIDLGMIGIAPDTAHQENDVFSALAYGFSKTQENVDKIYNSVCALVSGNAPFSDLGGPILIAQLAGKSARAGFLSLILFTAFISVNLAFVNILPIPGLDGGHLLIILLESITRREFSVKVRIRIQQVGMAILMLLIVSVLYNDIARLISG
ncbi:MAG: RIP metalloprotease RseP [Candidatus Marinimicrobia bacterium]|jgi:regulator of sigma E protease|nr:RIP metalloprotease RseP [Candidatus Neomarinimicrobiota bacterium]MDP7026098.1 RIP metalloprotease RseP [Candidatus Neomarinimicrobiota bacterium]